MLTNAPRNRDANPVPLAAMPSREPQSPWTSLAHPAGSPLLTTRSLWSAGMAWLEGGRDMPPVRIEIRRGRDEEYDPLAGE